MLGDLALGEDGGDGQPVVAEHHGGRAGVGEGGAHGHLEQCIVVAMESVYRILVSRSPEPTVHNTQVSLHYYTLHTGQGDLGFVKKHTQNSRLPTLCMDMSPGSWLFSCTNQPSSSHLTLHSVASPTLTSAQRAGQALCRSRRPWWSSLFPYACSTSPWSPACCPHGYPPDTPHPPTPPGR